MKNRWMPILPALALAMLLGACNGTITSIEIPAESPYTEMVTGFYSSEPFPFALTDGDGLNAEAVPLLEFTSGDLYGVALCSGASEATESGTRDYIRDCGDIGGGDPFCTDALETCIDSAPPDIIDPDETVTVKDIRFQNILFIGLDREDFTSGIVGIFNYDDEELESTVRVKISDTGTLRVIGDGDDGLVPGFTEPPGGLGFPGVFDELSWLEMFPPWEEFGPDIECLDGTDDCFDIADNNFAAICDPSGFEGGNVVMYRTSADAGRYSLQCGNVPTDVILDAPRPIKELARENLTLLLPTGSNQVDQHIEKAIDRIDRSLADNLWVDDIHLDPRKGNQVFNWEQQAAHELEKAIARGVSEEVEDFILGVLADLLLADQLLAETAIDEAIVALGSGDCDEAADRIADAQEDLAAAEADAADGDVDKAIQNYRKAWQNAQKAVEALDACS